MINPFKSFLTHGPLTLPYPKTKENKSLNQGNINAKLFTLLSILSANSVPHQKKGNSKKFA